MAYATINFEHPITGAIRSAPVGFSWTTFFVGTFISFGLFPALYRHHWLGAFVLFLLWVLTSGLALMIASFFYNKIYIRHLLKTGYKVHSASHDLDFLAAQLNLKLPTDNLKTPKDSLTQTIHKTSSNSKKLFSSLLKIIWEIIRLPMLAIAAVFEWVGELAKWLLIGSLIGLGVLLVLGG